MTNDGGSAPGTRSITRLVGVYDADGTITGEVAYWVGARLGRRHCSLCDITHGMFRRRAEWDACRAGLPVPFDTYHRNDQPERVRATAHDAAPVVVAETTDGWRLLLTDAEIGACDGSVDALVAAVESAVEREGLTWPSA